MPAILEDIHGSSSIDPDVAEKSVAYSKYVNMSHFHIAYFRLHAQFEELNAGYPNQMMTYDEFEAFVRTCQGFVFPRCLELQEKLMDASSLGRARWKELSKIRKDNSPKGPLSAQDYIEAMVKTLVFNIVLVSIRGYRVKIGSAARGSTRLCGKAKAKTRVREASRK
jgi:hypothetical protein